jgi:GrpE protein
MMTSQLRRDLAAACAVLAVFTGVVVYLLTGRIPVGLTALAGAAVCAGLPLLLGRRGGAPVVAVPDADRAALIQTCIYLRERVTSSALASRIDQALAQVGVDPVDPTGQRFDPGHHEAGGTVATTDDALVGTIAAVEAPGYADRGVPLRAPVVTVYQRRAS